MTKRTILLGNEAIAHGLMEGACTMAASYPGTPASEILGSLVKLREAVSYKPHLEWSINEKVAFEVALANSYAGRRSAVIMKQVGLNVAADPLMSAAYTGVKGGFVVISADDPGPHSSQTEQDSRFMAMLAKIPVLDPSSPAEALEMAREAFALSEKYESPVMLRPTTRVCHARQDVEVVAFPDARHDAAFEKNPGRWAATPKFRLVLHGQLNDKLARIAEEAQYAPRLVGSDGAGSQPAAGSTAHGKTCIVTSGVALAHVREILTELDLSEAVPVYQVVMPFPLSPAFRDAILEQYERILVLEESYPVIELQLQNRVKVFGRTTGTVPSAGELLPEVVERVMREFLGLPPAPAVEPSPFPGRRPTLCAGCPHRPAFYAIRKAFPKGIYPGDIGCYTLGLNLGAVDTVLCMGASISQATGFYHAYKDLGDKAPPICATVGDSTFFHAGIPALINAVAQGARFVLTILDNRTTAMTGHQPTPALGRNLDGSAVSPVSIPDLVKACGVRFIETEDPYHLQSFIDLLKQARQHAESESGGVAVVVSKRACLMDRAQTDPWDRREIRINEDCTHCRICVKTFECPAIVSQGEDNPVRIDQTLCTGCGVCLEVCPHGAIESV